MWERNSESNMATSQRQCSLLGELACQSILIPEDTTAFKPQVEFKLERLALSTVSSGLGADRLAEWVAGQAALESRELLHKYKSSPGSS